MPLMSIIQEFGERFELTTTTGHNRHGSTWCHSRVYYRIRSGRKTNLDPYSDNESVELPGERKRYETLQESLKKLSSSERNMLIHLLEKGS